MMQTRSPLERLGEGLCAFLRAERMPLLSGLVTGLAAHGFAMSNKLLNADETTALFSKGATIDSGRWALELLRLVFPDVSVPWLWGLVSLVLVSLAACLTLRIFRIRNPLLRLTLPALFVSFPSLTGIFCFMFTSAPYALCFLLAVLAVYIFAGTGTARKRWLLGCSVLVFSLGIYQAYVALTAGFFVLLMLQRLLEGEKAGAVFRFGLSALGMLALSLALYYALARLAVKLSGGSFLLYSVEQQTGILMRLALAFNAFVKSLTQGYFGFVNSPLSACVHGLGFGLCFCLGAMELAAMKDWRSRGLFLLCVVLLPLAMNSIFLISSAEIIHSLVLYSFVCLYVLAALLLDRVKGPWLRDLVLLCLMLTVLNNVFFANKVYLKMHLQYEHAYAYYTGLITRIQMTEGYTEATEVWILGDYGGLPEHPELDTGDLFGPSEDLVNIYTRNDFVKNYIGFMGDLHFVNYRWTPVEDERCLQMPCYPNPGSLQWLDGKLVVRLS